MLIAWLSDENFPVKQLVIDFCKAENEERCIPSLWEWLCSMTTKDMCQGLGKFWAVVTQEEEFKGSKSWDHKDDWYPVMLGTAPPPAPKKELISPKHL